MQDKPQVANYGAWQSPVTPAIISDQVVAYEAIAVDSVNGKIYHVERRLIEGRSVLVDSGQRQDVIDMEYNCRSVVHGYGGAPVAIRDGVIFFTNAPDMRIYKIEGDSVRAVTPDAPQFRFACLTLHPVYSHLMVAVREDHSNPKPANVVDTVVCTDLRTGTSKVIVSGSDFYANPVFSPSGRKLAWLRWNHPDMPFRSTQLVVADVRLSSDGQISVRDEIVVAGKPHVSVAQQPLWVDEDTVVFLHDVDGWLQPWVHNTLSRPILQHIIPGDFAEAMWGLGMSSCAIFDDDHILSVVVMKGFASLILISISSGACEEIPSAFVDIKYLKRISPYQFVFVGSKIDAGEAVVKLSFDRGVANPTFQVLASSSATPVPAGFVARPERFVSTDSAGRDVYALFYPPTNPDFVAPENEKPPCVVNFHAGPTSRTTPQFLWDRILYTSRGWAWLDVMFSGSSGYGRKYMERLDGKAGDLDVQDCVEATRQTASKGVIDIHRVVVTGSIPGGPSVLMSLINFPDFYAAGTSKVSVCDLAELHRKAPKLQLHYLELVLGGSPEEVPDVYKARSPLFHAGKIRAPVLLAHGKLDLVVPVDQTDAIAEEIRKHGGRVEYLRFEDEGHGFRKAESVRHVQERQLAFFEGVFGFNN
ncbi:alpha/beta-hydrolase [Roridomyces roridus]|uniref:Alpha/beta-hydrolase n=1 Tax=Roridomyces roridus TaxID=1738132 RepID=A0AAD7BMC5_9AGAR|nr:alpha/beta-hydrolase [Roridomyces roridus]